MNIGYCVAFWVVKKEAEKHVCLVEEESRRRNQIDQLSSRRPDSFPLKRDWIERIDAEETLASVRR